MASTKPLRHKPPHLLLHSSEYALLTTERRTYRTDPDYEHAKSYSYADQKIFRKQATSEGLRIKNLVLLCPQRTGRAIHLLLKQGLLSCEELLGIESALSTNPKQESRERRSYIDLVLATQKEMRKQNDDFVGLNVGKRCHSE
ncbi:hypothetical protein HJC23_001341 [Cyclotella cryptica]|uniref:Uncharacterized protein n=1 Tax=Cyclotella cryptica TaxID=29204 RepID=A0ABD3PMW9_9STRA